MAIVRSLRAVAIGIALSYLLPLTVHMGLEIWMPVAPYVAEENFATAQEYQQHLKDREISRAYRAYTNLLVGLLFVLTGLFVIPIPIISTSFMIGGAICIVFAYFDWPHLDRWLRFGSLLLAIALLIMAGVRMHRTNR